MCRLFSGSSKIQTQPSFLIEKWSLGIGTHSPAIRMPFADLLTVHFLTTWTGGEALAEEPRGPVIHEGC